MMKKKDSVNQELDFNFDEPMPVGVGRNEQPKKDSGFMSEIKDADSYGWGRSKTSRRGNMLTAEEVMGRSYGVAQQPVKEDKPVAEKPVSEPKPSGEAEQPSEMSFAARMMMQRMKELESSLPKPKIEDPPIIETMEFDDLDVKVAEVDTIEMEPFKPERSERKAEPVVQVDELAPMAEKELEPEAEPVEIAAEEPVSEPAEAPADEYDISQIRKKYVEEFELDNNYIDTASEDNGSTVAFEPVSEAEPIDDADGATRVMQFATDEFDFDLPTDDKGDEVETIDDYSGIDDAEAVISDFTHRRRMLTLRSIASAVISALLVILTFANGVIPFELPAFYITFGVLLGLGMLFNIGIFSSVTSLIKGKCDTDFAPMFALVVAFVQNLTVGLTGATEGMTAVSMCGAAAMLSVTFNCIGKLYMVRRILINLENVANDEYKTAATLIDAPVSSYIADPSKLGETLIVGRRKTVDLQGFIGYSLSPDRYEAQSFRLMLVAVGGALAAAVIALATGGGAVGALNAAAMSAAVCAPFSALSTVGRRMFKLAKRLRNEGAMLSGFKAADEIGEANAIVLGAEELYSDSCVSLYNFKTFSDFPIDTAIMTAAALTKEGNSPLADMFNQIVATNSGKLPPVDSVLYEEKMGLTGWVDDRKTLIGNRMILESHNIPVPPLSVDKKIISSGKFPVYLAVDDKIAAMFIVAYSAKKSIVHRIRRLVNTGVTLLVSTSDPNISEHLVADTYGIPDDAVMVLSAGASRRYTEHTAPAEREQARLASATTKGFIDGYIAAYNLRQSSSVSTVITLIMVCLGLAAVMFTPLLGIGNFINSLSIVILHVVNYLLVSAVNFFTRS